MKKLNKTFILLQFGKPHEWTQQFIDNVQSVKDYGFNFMIVTPNNFESKGNVIIVKMDINQFNSRCEEKLGIKPTLRITERGIPNFHITDTMTGFGVIFEDYLQGADFWGLIGLDNVVGRLDHFIPDKLLETCNIYSDDINTFNGNFSLVRNNKIINELFKHVEGWENAFTQTDCEGCVGNGVHRLFGTDEYILTKILRSFKDIKFKYPKYFIHGHDRLEIHQPKPNLNLEEDGSLWELINDVNQPDWEHAHNNFGHEIAYFHFSQTKRWPI